MTSLSSMITTMVLLTAQTLPSPSKAVEENPHKIDLDPSERNAPPPDVTILYTVNNIGYIEPCG